MNRHITTCLLLAVATILLVACGAPPTEQAGTSTPIAASATSTETSFPTAPTITTPPATSVSTAAPTVVGTQPARTQVPDAPATPSDADPGVGTDVVGSNVFNYILGATSAPEGLTVKPCEWKAPVLCVLSGDELTGQVELFMSHLDTLPEFQQTLVSAGLTPGSIDYRDPRQAPGLASALKTFVEDYHGTFEEDRRLTYGDKATYTRLETQEVQVAEIPGLRYGFVVHDNGGKVLERWISFAAFDGNILYILTPHYDPRSHMSFRSDEELQTFEPYMREIVTALKLPLPVLETPVQQVVTLARVPLFRFYGNGSNPVAEAPAGQTLMVSGRSPGDAAWRVECPGDVTGECWVSAHPKLTRPSVP